MNDSSHGFVASKTSIAFSWTAIFGLMLVALILLGCGPTTPPTRIPSPVPAATLVPNSPTAIPASPTTAPTEPVSVSINTVAPTTTIPPNAPPTATRVPPSPTPDAQHKLVRPDMKLRKVADVGAFNIKLARNPRDGELYYLHPDDGVFHLDLKTSDTSRVIARTDIVTNGNAAGMAFASDGTLYVVFNQNVPPNDNTRAVIRKGAPSADGKYTWTTLAQTEPYPLAGNNFDHYYNGIVVSPDNKYVFVNAGSRSDHGEIEDHKKAFPGLREVPLTSAILRIPTDAQDLILPADENGLAPYLFADGTRNTYDPEFAPNGDLIVGDNGPDADFPDELNWIREGHHYGFPWKFGTQDNPQQFRDYSPYSDKRLQNGFFAVDNGFYQNDKTFPTPPPGVTFTAPIVNLGPDADKYRADDGSEHDSSDENKSLNTFTPHRSPLGLVFVTGDKMPADLRGTDSTISALITSWGAAAGTLSDRGADVLHLQLTKKGDNYEMVTQQIATGFIYPIDGVLIDNKYYLLEWDPNGGGVWEITFGE